MYMIPFYDASSRLHIALCRCSHYASMALFASETYSGALYGQYTFACRWRISDSPQDEVFHVAQAIRYCEGKWTEWDPKLTTPPALLVRYTVIAQAFETIHTDTCTLMFCMQYQV